MEEVNGQVKVNTYLSIIDYVRENSKLPELNLSKQARNRYVQRLKSQGILIKKGYGTWGIDEVNLKAKTSKQTSKRTLSNLKIIRGHGFCFTLRLKNLPRWKERGIYLTKKNIQYKAIKQGISISVDDYLCWLCKDSIVVHFPNYKDSWGADCKESKAAAVNDFLGVIKKIEGMLGVDLSFSGKYEYRTSKQHFAKVRDQLAKDYNDKGKKLQVRGNDGKVWLLADKSLNVDELETVHKDTGVTDHDKVVIPFMNDLKEHYDTTGETLVSTDLLKGLHAQKNNVDSVVNLFKMYGENVVAHIDVNRSIAAGMHEFTDTVKQLNAKVDRLDKLYKDIRKVYKKKR